MPLIVLKLPPGIRRSGTRYESRNRWYDGNLVRFLEGAKRPIGGWEELDLSDLSAVTFHAVARLTLAANAGNTQTVTLDTKVYTFQDELSNVDGNVHIGSDAEESIDNLVAGIMLAAGSGSKYAAAMTLHPTVSAKAGPGDTMVAEAKSDGLEGVGIASTETLASGSWDESALIGNMPRAIIGWKDNSSNASQLAIGTNSRIYQFAQGTLTDLTPEALTTGNVDTTASVGGYGVGAYGIGSYGVGDSSQAVVTEAASWQLDTFGDYLVGVLTSDGTLWQWTGSGILTAVTNAPSNNTGVVVTPERFVVALGADGNPRQLMWADQESLTDWTPSSSNQAGDWILAGAGTILCGWRGRNETLIFTDRDLFAMQYIGGTLVYAVQQLGSSCGAISRHAVVTVDGKAVWMGHRGFFAYDGFVRSLPSDVGDYVFKDFNRMQQAKCWAVPLANFGEVWFFYCSSGSQEPDRYVIWNFRENHWSIGKLARTAGMDRGTFEYPMFVDSTRVYDQERGSTHDGADTPFVESGPIELGNGANVMMARQLFPDEATIAGQVLGSVNATIYSAMYPTATETTHGPYTLANPTSVRLTGRQVRIRLEEIAAGDWRVGDLRLEAVPAGLR